MRPLIRKALDTDCTALSVLKQAVWETTYRGIYPDDKLDQYDVSKNAEKFKNIIQNPAVSLFAVECEGELVGYMSCGTLIRPFRNFEYEIGLLYVKKEYQGMGIGRRLFELGASELHQCGAREFIISCNRFNEPAVSFYQKMGGKLIHTDPIYEDKSRSQVKFLYAVEGLIK